MCKQKDLTSSDILTLRDYLAGWQLALPCHGVPTRWRCYGERATQSCMQVGTEVVDLSSCLLKPLVSSDSKCRLRLIKGDMV